MKRSASCRIGDMWKVIAALVAIVLLPAGAALAAVEREEVSTVSVPLQGARVVVITNARGDVRVVGERGRSDISIEIRKVVKAKGDEETARLFGAMKLEVAREGREITVRAVYPEETERERSIIGYIMQHYPSIRIDVDLKVPAGLNVSTVTSSGDVQISGVDDAVEVNSASGDVEVSDVGGAVKAHVASGSVSLARIGADASVTSASGDIEVEEIKGNASMQTASGDIDLVGIGGNLTATSTSGDVTADGVASVSFTGASGGAEFTGVRGGVTASVTSGDIEVSAAPESAANYEIRTSSGEIVLEFKTKLPGGFVLKARTTTGDISIDLPIQVSKVGRHDLAGVVGAGTSVVVVETASGDITVTEPGE